jgi:oligoribonuclease
MPELEQFLHYRLVDVTSVKIMADHWFPELKGYKKKNTHLARDDILESIEELRYYRQHIFKQSANSQQ